MPSSARPKERPTLKVDPATDPIVKEVFESSLRGNGLKEICKELNGRGVSNKGKRWQKNVLHYLLTNEAYTGTAVWGRKSKDEEAPVDGPDVFFPSLYDLRGVDQDVGGAGQVQRAGVNFGRGGDCRRGCGPQGDRIRYVMAGFDSRRPVARISGGAKNEGPAVRTPRLVPVGYRGWVAGISASFPWSQNTCPDYGRTPMLRWKAPIRAGW